MVSRARRKIKDNRVRSRAAVVYRCPRGKRAPIRMKMAAGNGAVVPPRREQLDPYLFVFTAIARARDSSAEIGERCERGTTKTITRHQFRP